MSPNALHRRFEFRKSLRSSGRRSASSASAVWRQDKEPPASHRHSPHPSSTAPLIESACAYAIHARASRITHRWARANPPVSRFVGTATRKRPFQLLCGLPAGRQPAFARGVGETQLVNSAKAYLLTDASRKGRSSSPDHSCDRNRDQHRHRGPGAWSRQGEERYVSTCRAECFAATFETATCVCAPP